MAMTAVQESICACRRLLRRPLLPVGIVVTLTLGIGISTTMFSVLHGIVLRGLPYPNGERIVDIHSENLEQGVSRARLTTSEVQSR